MAPRSTGHRRLRKTIHGSPQDYANATHEAVVSKVPTPTSDPTITEFETFYARAMGDLSAIPWAHERVHPLLVAWLDEQPHREPSGAGRALVIASGLGDDAEELARRGWDVSAFDASPTAIAWTRRRYPDTTVAYVVADLFDLPKAWVRAFDLVVENRTIQSLPPARHSEAIAAIAATVAPGGVVVAIAHGRDDVEPALSRPWPLSKRELDLFQSHGLAEQSFSKTHRSGGLRLFRAVYSRPISDSRDRAGALQ
jgi:SAM-dependent methyltransferase